MKSSSFVYILLYHSEELKNIPWILFQFPLEPSHLTDYRLLRAIMSMIAPLPRYYSHITRSAKLVIFHPSRKLCAQNRTELNFPTAPTESLRDSVFTDAPLIFDTRKMVRFVSNFVNKISSVLCITTNIPPFSCKLCHC